ncbi:hypothetical protein ABFX02_11G039100 [Erythranthe guttata]
MAPYVVSLFSRKGAVGVSNWISRKGAVGVSSLISRRCGFFRSPISTLSVSDESLRSPSSLPSKISPWLMLPPTAAGGGCVVHKFYSIAENRVLCFAGEAKLGFPDGDTELVGSSHGWLALSNKRNNDLFLTNPLSRRRVNLPPIHKLPIEEQHLSREDFSCVHNVIISCSPNEENCRAMMIIKAGYALAFCCPGLSTAEWTPIGTRYVGQHDVRCYRSIIYSATHKLFFCLIDRRIFDTFEAWDLRDPDSPTMIPMDYPVIWLHSEEDDQRNEFCHTENSLVEYSGELFFVERFIAESVDSNGRAFDTHLCYSPKKGRDHSRPYKTMNFNVYKFDPESRSFRFMDSSLDGLVFFIGRNHAFAIAAASEYPELKADSIYYTDVTNTSYAIQKIDYGGHDIGIFSYKDRTFSPCYYPCDVKGIKVITPYPIWYTPTPL